MEVAQASADFSPRQYQLEILDEALEKNVIVCLGTGTGKTFISVMLIKELAHQIKGDLKNGGKRTFFLVNTVPLVNQQSKAIDTHTNLTVGKYSGDMGVDFWDRQRWEDEFNQNDVLVMTAQILYNMLNHGFVTLSNINLLLLDECHHASGNHPYAKIMEMMADCVEKPRIMGLTASIINKKPKKVANLHTYLETSMKDLECMMRAVCVTCFNQNATAQYATRPDERVLVFKATRFDISPKVAELDEIIGEQLYSAESFLVKVKSSNKNGARDLCIDVIKELLEIRNSLGLWCTYKAAKCIKQNLVILDKKCVVENDKLLLQMVITKVTLISSMFKKFVKESFGSMDNISLTEPIITAKAKLVMDLLRKSKKGLCAIIFVQRRVTSTVLSDFINDVISKSRESYEGMKSDFVYGHNIEEVLKGGNMTSRNQEKVLQNFRNGEFNVLVSTSVVEEGVDVRKCNLVIKFDGISNYREYVQSKGRARAANSAFVVLADKESAAGTERDLNIFREIENILHEKSQGREEPTDAEIKNRFDEDELIKPFKISNDEGAPRISKDNAIQLLHMYCSKLPSDQYSVPRPVCEVVKDGFDFTATVRFPMNCPVQEVIEGEAMPTERLAKMSAAQTACIRLYEAGELDANFLPFKDVYSSNGSEEETGQETDAGAPKAGTKKARKTYSRKIADSFDFPNEFPNTGLFLYELKMTLVKPRDDAFPLWPVWYHEDRKGYGLLTAVELPEIPSFPLFTKAGEVAVEVVLVQSKVNLLPYQARTISGFHEQFFQKFAPSFVENREFSRTMAKQKAMLVPLFNRSSTASHDGQSYIDLDVSIENTIDFDFINQLTIADSAWAGNASRYEDAMVKRTYLETNQSFYVVSVRNDMNVMDHIADNEETFKAYYKRKYGKNIKDNQPLLESVRSDSRINYITPRYANEGSTKTTTRSTLIHLVPELCVVAAIPASMHCQAVCIPSLLFRLETILVAGELRNIITNQITPNRPSKRRKIASNQVEKDIKQIYQQKRQPQTKRRSHSVSFEGFFTSSQESSELRLKDVTKKLERSLSGSKKAAYSSIQVSDILQCLTTSKANAGFDLERLETLGDIFLKLATSVFLYFKYPTANEGRLTEKRMHYVSNKKLATVAKNYSIPSMIVNTAFGVKKTGKEEDVVYDLARDFWIPPMYKHKSSKEQDLVKSPGVQSIPRQVVADKCLADCVEALIGASYEYGGVQCSLKFLRLLGIDCFYEEAGELQEVGKYANFPLAPSALLPSEDSLKYLGHFYTANRCEILEKQLNYRFKDKSFLIQAMTHMSCDSNRATGCYQRLEFLGDSILDFLVISHLYENHTGLDPSSLTDIKSALVNNNTFSLLTVKNKLHKCLMHSSPSLIWAISQFIQQIEDGSKDIESLLKNPFIIVFDEHSEEQEGYCAPKVLGDIFESLAGAVFLDSKLDLVAVWRVFFPMLKPLIDAYVEDVPINPVRKIHERFPNASQSCGQLDNGKMKCTWTVDGRKFEGIGQNSIMAKAAAAQRALFQST